MISLTYRIALYLKLSRLERTKQFHEIIFTISGMGPHFLESFSSNYTSELAVDMNDDGISLDKRSVGLGKAHLELLVAACKNF